MIRGTCVYRNWTTRWIFSRIFYAITKNRTFYLPGPARLCRVERLLDWWVFSFDFVVNSQTCFPPTAVGTQRYTRPQYLEYRITPLWIGNRVGLSPVFVNFQFQLSLAPITYSYLGPENTLPFPIDRYEKAIKNTELEVVMFSGRGRSKRIEKLVKTLVYSTYPFRP